VTAGLLVGIVPTPPPGVVAPLRALPAEPDMAELKAMPDDAEAVEGGRLVTPDDTTPPAPDDISPPAETEEDPMAFTEDDTDDTDDIELAALEVDNVNAARELEELAS